MLRPSPWLMLVVLLLGILLLREPRFALADDLFLRWLLEHSQTNDGPAVPLTVVEIGRDSLTATAPEVEGSATPNGTRSSAISPLEYALFLQSVLDFQPNVVAFENALKWRERDKDQEQVFLDQAMRVPKLLLASELGQVTDPDAPWTDIRGFAQVTGKRSELATFSGIARQPNEDLRLISTQGFVNLPNEIASEIRVPLLFLYRGEVIPSFALQTILLWLRVTPAEVKVELGSHILLPQDRKIPIQADGTMLIDPNVAKRVRRMSLNELLLAAQQRDTGDAAAQPFVEIRDQVVLARAPENPLSPPDVFAAAIASIQANSYLRRISPIFDCVILLLVAAGVGVFRRIERFDLMLYGIAFTAAYCLIALGTMSRWSLWLPGVVPLGLVWLSIAAAFVFRKKNDPERDTTIAIPPPIP